jgi:8-oxo-dGTP pyrophosphatase MutT (NUDIX family)
MIKKASSLILIHLTNHKPKILLLKRSDFGFYARMAVFAGGKVDDLDYDDAIQLSLGPGNPFFTKTNDRHHLDSLPDDVDLMALKICAIRETFEECGLLLNSMPSSIDGKFDVSNLELKSNIASLSNLQSNTTSRSDCTQGSDPKSNTVCKSLANLYKSKGIIMPLDRLVYYSNWISPLHFGNNRYLVLLIFGIVFVFDTRQ